MPLSSLRKRTGKLSFTSVVAVIHPTLKKMESLTESISNQSAGLQQGKTDVDAALYPARFESKSRKAYTRTKINFCGLYSFPLIDL